MPRWYFQVYARPHLLRRDSSIHGCFGGWVWGRTQVKKRPTHAHPGMHMQQCSAVQMNGHSHTKPCSTYVQRSTSALIALFGRVFFRPRPLAYIHSTHSPLVYPSGLLTAGTSLAVLHTGQTPGGGGGGRPLGSGRQLPPQLTVGQRPLGGGGLVWFGSRPVPDALAHGQHSPLCRHDWARRIAVVRSQGLPDC